MKTYHTAVIIKGYATHCSCLKIYSLFYYIDCAVGALQNWRAENQSGLTQNQEEYFHIRGENPMFVG